MDWRAQQGAKIVEDSFKKSDFWTFDAPEIHFLEQEADGKVDDYHYGQGANEQMIWKVVVKVLNFVESVVVIPFIINIDIYAI